MATLDRIEPAFTPWTPTTGGMATDDVLDDEGYVGRHRKPDATRMFSLRRLFHVARHRAR